MISPTRHAITTRKLLIASGAAVLLLGAFGVLAATRGGDPRVGKSGAVGSGGSRQTSDLVEVVKSDFDITTTCSGELRARNQIEVRNTLESETSIIEIIPEGTVVKQGDVLVKLNSEPIQTRLDEESLALESARSLMVEAEQSYQIQLSENDSAKRQADLKLVLAQLDLEQWRKGEVESKRQELDHALDRTQKDETRLEDKFNQSKVLKEKGYYSADQLRQDELAYEQAVAALEKAKLDKKVYWDFQYPKDEKKKMSDVEEAAAEKERVLRQNESKLASKEADRNNKKQSLTIRQQKHAKAIEQLAASTIKAPGAGLVVYSTSMDSGMRWGNDDGPLQVGRKVYPNELLIILPDTSEMIASVKVHESLAGRIHPGQPATIKIDAAGERRYTGKVETIGILAEQTSRWMDPNLREYTVRIALEMPASEGKSHGLKPSMRAEAEVFLGTVTDAITVPIQAVFSDGLVRYVHLPEGNRFVRRPVSIGRRSDRFAEIKVGVEPGQRVLIRKPEPAEILSRNWETAELAAVGLKMNDQGTIVPEGGPAGAPPAGMAGGPGGVKDRPPQPVAAPSTHAEATAEPGTSDVKKDADAAPPAAPATGAPTSAAPAPAGA
jgi:HlyD family secretion protein